MTSASVYPTVRWHSELYRALCLLEILSDGMTYRGVMLGVELSTSPATVKRDVEFCRKLGADIIGTKDGYRLLNWPDIKRTVNRWLKLEQQREVIRKRIADDQVRFYHRKAPDLAGKR